MTNRASYKLTLITGVRRADCKSGPTERWRRPVGPLGQPIPPIEGARARSIPMWQAAFKT